MDYSVTMDGVNSYTLDMSNSVNEISQLYNIFRFVLIIIVALEIFSNWNIFKKAGEKSWKAIIPFYNYYTMYKVMWNVKYFWISMGISLGISIISMLLLNKVVTIDFVIIILLICNLIIQIILNYNMAKKFEHGILFTIGLVFFNTIFKLILALDNSEYINPDDVVIKKVEVNHNKE